MIEVGRLAVKIAGRDAGKTCVVVEIKGNKVLIDGQTRRRYCNPAHLEPLAQKLELKEGASHAEVVEALKKLGIEVKERKPKEKKERPRKLRLKKKKAVTA